RPVVVGVFQRLADGLALLVTGDVTELAVRLEPTVIIAHRAPAICRPRPGVIDAGEAFRLRLGDHRYRVIADHGAGLDALQRPYRGPLRTLVGLAHQPLHQVRHLVG